MTYCYVVLYHAITSHVDFTHVSGHLKVVYMTESCLMIYMCPTEDSLGVCAPDRASVIFYHRTTQPLGDLLERVIESVDSMCISLEDFNIIDHTGGINLCLLLLFGG